MTVNIALHPRFPANAVQLFLRGWAVNPVVRFRETWFELELKRNRAPSNERAGPRQLASPGLDALNLIAHNHLADCCALSEI